MIAIRTAHEIVSLRKACTLAAHTMEVVRDAVKPGMTTADLAHRAKAHIEENGGKPAFLGYNGFPGAICVSINDEVVHGIPGERVLGDGDLVKIDLGTIVDGFYGDMARTYAVGTIEESDRQLIDAAEASFYEGAARALPGNRVGDIGHAVQSYLEPRGYGVVRALVGHGIGRNLHEEPQVPNFGRRGTGPILKAGMVLAIEPMVNSGTWEVDTLDDDWTVVTADGDNSAHFENTCLVADGYPEILTRMNGDREWQKTIH